MIPISSSARIWIATGYTDMRKGMQGLSLLVQESLGRDPFAGDVFVFRGRGGSLIKALWHDGIGLSLYSLQFCGMELCASNRYVVWSCLCSVFQQEIVAGVRRKGRALCVLRKA